MNFACGASYGNAAAKYKAVAIKKLIVIVKSWEVIFVRGRGADKGPGADRGPKGGPINGPRERPIGGAIRRSRGGRGEVEGGPRAGRGGADGQGTDIYIKLQKGHYLN